MSWMIWVTRQSVAFIPTEKYWFTLSAPGPVMRCFSSRTSIPCTSAPERLTPITWPVVRNKYVTERQQSTLVKRQRFGGLGAYTR